MANRVSVKARLFQAGNGIISHIPFSPNFRM